MAPEWTSLKPETRESVKREALAEYAESERVGLGDIRVARQQTQVAVAEQMHVPRCAVSQLEDQNDCLLSILRQYIGALGGTLEMRAVFPDGAVDLGGLMRMQGGAEEQLPGEAAPGNTSNRRAAPQVDFRTLLEGSLDLVCQVEHHADGSRRFVYVSPSAAEIVGWSAEELIGLPPEIICTEEANAIVAADGKKLAGGSESSMVLMEAVRKDGTHVWLENKVRVLETHPQGGMSVMVCMRDVTQRKLLEEELARMALVDGLTGIDNRRAFDQAFDREWKSALRLGSALSLILFDVDHFKLFNDRYGHQVGDDCLQAIAHAARSAVNRPGDVVARYGGEEFVLLLPDTDLSGATHLANRLCQKIEELKIPHEGNRDVGGFITISCGVSTRSLGPVTSISSPADTRENLLFSADHALYEAKKRGRNRVATSAHSGALDASRNAS